MQRILGKRVLRDLKENLFRYMALAALVIFAMFIVIGVIGAADTIMIGTDRIAEEQNADEVEDTYFAEYWENSGGKVDELKKGINDLYDGTRELRDGLSTLSKNSDKLKGASDDIFDSYLDQANSQLSGYGIEELTRDNYQRVLEDFEKSFDSGLARLEINGLLSDLRDLDSYVEGVQEYTGGVDQASDGSTEIADGVAELKEQTDEFIEEEWGDVRLGNMTSFLIAEDNLRIGGAADDQVINKYGGLVAGVILIILFAYVISIFVIHSIEKDAVVIGALYSLGVKRTELILHFVTLPVVVTFVGGVIGTMLGFTTFGVRYQMQDCYHYYSIPELVPMHPLYLILYGVVVPPVIAAIVNYIVIRKKLSVPALKLLRNEHKQSRGSRIDLSRYEFTKAFQIRQILKEGRSAIAVVLGMFISLVLVMMSLDCYVLCKNVKEDNVEDTKFEYMYVYKYPEKTVPEGGEEAYVKTLKKKTNGYNFDVSILGTKDKSKYFDVETTDNQTHVVISSALSTKFLVYAGDELTLTDEEHDRLYSFIVDEVVEYAPTFYVFMKIEDARDLFGESSEFYNVVFSDQELDIDSGRLYSLLTKSQVEAAADVFIDLMKSFMVTILGGSVFIFFVVMYLMMKVMIDRSAFNIAMMKIFGYRKKEIRKLYLNGNFYMIAVGAMISCPLAKCIMDKMYPVLCANVSCA